MVRFIIVVPYSPHAMYLRFTFQYGQIYYKNGRRELSNSRFIYIPIWLDLLST